MGANPGILDFVVELKLFFGEMLFHFHVDNVPFVDLNHAVVMCSAEYDVEKVKRSRICRREKEKRRKENKSLNKKLVFENQ